MFEYGGAGVYKVPVLDLLHPELRVVLEGQLYEAACDAFCRQPTQAFEQDVKAHLRDGSLYVVIQGGKGVGFAVMKDFSEIRATYISGIIKKRTIASGVIEKIVERHVSGFGIVVVRTQNDRVVEIMRDTCRKVVPLHREAGEPERRILEYMRLDRSNNGEIVGPDMVARKHYGGESMIGDGIRRRSRIFEVKELTDRLAYQEGDALLLVGYK